MRVRRLMLALLAAGILLGGAFAARLPSHAGSAPVYYRNAAIVLMYHHLDEKESSATISPGRFAAHLDMLRAAGYRVVELERITAFLAGEADLPPNAVAITFDDAYESVFRYAYPALAERGLPASVFVITGQAGSREGLPKLTWDEMRLMQEAGFRFYSHTHDSHRYVAVNARGGRKPALVGRQYLAAQGRQETPAEYAGRVEADLRLSRLTLEEELGRPVNMLAYPFGWGSGEAARLAEEAGFQYLFTIKPALITRASPRQALGRLNAGTPLLDAAGLARAMRALWRKS